MYTQFSNLYPDLQERIEYRKAKLEERRLNRAAGMLFALFVLGVAACILCGVSLTDLPTNLG